MQRAHTIPWKTLMIGLGLAGLAGGAGAAEILVTTDIAIATTWTADNVYNLQTQIYVLPGATLTIEAGTVLASEKGSLAVCRGARIYVLGTAVRPVIMTSKADDLKTWREAANEWGNLTIMGNGYISANRAGNSNVNTPNANNWAPMEGLVAGGPGDLKIRYGGGDDFDDSGTIHYLSIRYGGKVVSLANELNGLSLGGVGKGTDIHHVEIMNNVDDGVEIWGGAVNLHHIAIWNIGDDSFDIDQGWRGTADHVLIVQGHSLNAAQGSGVGDNGVESDGAEDSDWLPVTTCVIENLTFIGQPFDGDRATAWRDNARVQYHRCLFMDCGEEVVGFDNKDGDGANGYGFNGTLSWESTWTTSYTYNPYVSTPANFATSPQTSGMLAEIKDSVFYNNTNSKAYTEANNRGVFNAANNNKQSTAMPIRGITRGTAVVKGGKAMVPVTSLDPRAAGDAAQSRYIGAFNQDNSWLNYWTASSAFGFTPAAERTLDLGFAKMGKYGDPTLTATGTLNPNTPVAINLANAAENTVALLVYGASRLDAPILGGVIVPDFTKGIILGAGTDPAGKLAINTIWPSGVPKGSELYFQAWIVDLAASQSLAVSNAILMIAP